MYCLNTKCKLKFQAPLKQTARNTWNSASNYIKMQVILN